MSSMPTDLPPSDDLQAIIYSAAAPLRPSDVADFINAVDEELRQHAQIGPGAVYRACRKVQRQYFDPPAQPYRGPRSGL